MKLTILTFFLAWYTGMGAFAQSDFQIKGSVKDTLSDTPIENASIMVLNSKDSTLVNFNWTSADGSFYLNRLKPGAFILLVTYPEYVDYIQQFTLDSTKQIHDFGGFTLIQKARLLQEVIVKGDPISVRMKGDTTEFNADAYHIPPNSKVEDLLRQLPGIQVDNNGRITAYGQNVNKILVDGEEFFGDDPTLITQNLRGDMVDKIQLFDKKSDQATFTGIDDRKKEKTLNVKLKMDKNNGYFGKVDGGGGTVNYYQGQAMFNHFSTKRKFAIYSNVANTGKIGLSSSDNNKYASYAGDITFVEGGIVISNGASDELSSSSGRYNGQGYPLAKTAGLHYDAKWNSDRQSINLNYKIGSLDINGFRNSLTQNILPSNSLNSNSDQIFNNQLFRQRLDAAYQIKLDTSSTLKVWIDGILRNTKNDNKFDSYTDDKNDVLLNQSNRRLNDDGNQQNFSINALYNKKLRKPGRTVSVSISESINKSSVTEFLSSTNQFFNAQGIIDSTQIIDQYKPTIIESNTLSGNVSFSEPLSPRLALALLYGSGINTTNAERNSFNESANGEYNLLDQVYSNNYLLRQFSNQGGALLNYKNDKVSIKMGTKATSVSFKQLDRYNNIRYDRKFLYWVPEVSYRYQFSSQRLLSLRYNGTTIQPSIDQIQPIRINIDPLNIVVGNTEIKPAFSNTYSADYHSLKILNGQSLNLGSFYSIIANPIVNNITTDATGKTTYQSVNLSQKKSNDFFFRISIGRNLKSLGSNISLESRFRSSKNYGFSNGLLHNRTSQSYSASLSISKQKSQKYTLRASLGPTYLRSESSIPNQLNNNGKGYNADIYFTLYLPLKMELGLNATYNFQGKTESFNNNFEMFILNSSLSKKFLDKKNLKFSISGNDLLNQNIGFRRSEFGTAIRQNSYTAINRFFMLSLIWDFSKFGKEGS